MGLTWPHKNGAVALGNDGQLIIVRMNLFVMYTVYCRFHMYIYIYNSPATILS